VDAQFNVRYGVALGLVRRQAGLSQFTTDSVVSDQDVADVAARVQIREIPNSEGLRTDQVRVTVTVVARDGRRLSHSTHLVKGDWREPFSFDEVVDKFNECVEFSNLWPMEQAAAIVDAVGTLETMPDVSVLARDLLVVQNASSFS
jgi:2-methylcitrate dehydratase PrpD